MSASDALSKPLFHGTGHYFGPGETIDPLHPGPSARSGSAYDPTPRTYATTDMSIAKYYARQAMNNNETMFAPIYEVEMHEPEEYEYGLGLYNSTKPMIPKKIAGWSTWNDYGEE